MSKNGAYLLNLSPSADGTIPPEQQDVRREIGRWLDVIGESIYATQVWTTFGSAGGQPKAKTNPRSKNTGYRSITSTMLSVSIRTASSSPKNMMSR